MKLKFLLFGACWMLLLTLACKNDEIAFDNIATSLKFSEDTVLCDTVYNQVRSETYAVKVYNTQDKDVMIPKIALESGSASPYRINVDGKAGYEFTNVPLRKKDSLYIFVEIAPVATSTQAIAQDRIVFSPTNQHITLLSVVQDAEFFIESATNPNILTANTNWNSTKAKIIYGNLTVAEGKILNIAAGTKVYFSKNSSLTLAKNASLNVSGDLGNEVIFRGDRNETRYDTIPMNWKGIVAQPGANISMNYAKVFGGETGLQMNSATANISNTIVHTFQNYGIETIASTLTAKNLVMNNCGEADLGIFKGGSVDLTHCTLANYWSMNSALPGYSLYASNDWKNSAGTTESGPLNLNVKNSVIYGNKDSAILFKLNTAQTFSYLFDSVLMKHGTNAGFVFENNASVISSIKNQDPKFVNYFTYKMNLRTANDSPAKAKGKLSYAQQVPLDIVKVSRTGSPTLGAYQ